MASVHRAAALLLVAWTSAALALGCAPRHTPGGPDGRLFDEDDPRAAADDVSPGADDDGANDDEDTQPAPETLPARTSRTNVSRGDLDRLLDAGPARLLKTLQLNPRLDLNDRFVGWEVAATGGAGADAPVRHGVDIRPGDVVKRINGLPISRPDQLHTVWEKLRKASTITVAGERGGQPFELRFDVVEGPAGSEI